MIDAQTRAAIPTADILIESLSIAVLAAERGDFIIAALPAGEYELKVQQLGYRTALIPLRVRAGRTTRITVELKPTPVEVEGIQAEVERVPLIEPEISVTHEVMLGRELLELPVDEVAEAVELTTGVSDGHFRGGRIGQESYRIDGLEVKNQFEASSQGLGLELSPSSLEEIEVVTGGFGADNGSALSGLVSYATRRGNSELWSGRAALISDQALPDNVHRGFSSLSVTAGGPVRFLGAGTTLFADVLAQGMADAEPRARGLTCLRPEDGDAQLADAIGSLGEDPATAHLYCPYSGPRLPYQRGDKLIGFLRLDKPLASGTNLTVSLLHNRRQNELFTPEFKYNTEFQLGQRTKGYLATLTLDWARHQQGRAYHVIARTAALRLDRYLGALDPWTFAGRDRVAGFGLADFRFLGEEFVRLPVSEQLESGSAVPGYVLPIGTTGSPFGPAAAGIFATDGTPEVANWSRSDLWAADLRGEILSSRGHALRAGLSSRFYRIENYERILAFLPGSSPSFARFYPRTISGFTEVSLLAADNITARFGVRIEAFQAGLSFQSDRADILSPVIDTRWRTNLMPRLGLAVPIPKTEDRSMAWFNYSRLAQPPDFRFFLDTSLGDSLRVDLRRQGNPSLTFEQGNSYELGVSQLINEYLALTVVAFFRELTNLVTSGLRFPDTPANQFTTGDFGSVKGLEISMRGRWPLLRLRAGYALQEAKGVTSGAFESADSSAADQRLEFPLAFDRRHTIDAAIFLGRSAGRESARWGAALTGAVRSGFPLDRHLAAGETGDDVARRARLPWTAVLDFRASYELGAVGLCSGCRWRVLADARNFLDRDNIIALRRDTGELAPDFLQLEGVSRELSNGFQPIPLESAHYSQLADLNRDGIITVSEFETARFAAALDASDPSLFFGEDLQIRLGLEVSF